MEIKMIVSIVVSLIIAGGLFSLISSKGKAKTALQQGRNWAAWTVFGGTLLILLYAFLVILDVASAVGSILCRTLQALFVLGVIAFVVGCFYWKNPKKNTDNEN